MLNLVTKAFGKLAYQINPNNRLWTFVEYEYWNMQNFGLSVNRPVEATNDQVGPAVAMAFNFLHTFTENTFSEIKLGYYDEYWEQRPNQGRDVPQRYDWLTGLYSGNSSWAAQNGTNQFTASATVTHHADDFIKGSHDFKVGVEYMRGKDNMKMEYAAGFTYTDNYPFSYYYYDYRYTTFAYSYGFDIKSNGWKSSSLSPSGIGWVSSWTPSTFSTAACRPAFMAKSTAPTTDWPVQSAIRCISGSE